MRSDFGGLANDHAGSVIDEEVRADLRPGMNINSRPAVRPFGHDTRDQRHFVVKQMGHSINRDCLQCRVSENDFLVTFRSRITFVSGVDVRPKQATHGGQFLQEDTQNFFRLSFGSLVRRNFSKASANFRFQSCVQIPDASARCIDQVFGAHQRLTAETWEHQAHQLRARRFDGET